MCVRFDHASVHELLVLAAGLTGVALLGLGRRLSHPRPTLTDIATARTIRTFEAAWVRPQTRETRCPY